MRSITKEKRTEGDKDDSAQTTIVKQKKTTSHFPYPKITKNLLPRLDLQYSLELCIECTGK